MPHPLTTFLAPHPLTAFLAPLPAADLATLNALAAQRGIVTGGGRPLRFALPTDDGLGYEARAFHHGIVATRADNPHDYFNALIWLAFPRAKAALNRRHALELADAASEPPATERATPTADRASAALCDAPGVAVDAAARAALSERMRGRTRGPVRDALTQFDECGVVIAGMPADLQAALRAHRWREVFVQRRSELLATTRFVVFGHASHDALRAPYVGLCGKALFLDADGSQHIDAQLAACFDSADLRPADLQPLPLLGIPGATPANADPAYYDNPRQFRPPRTMRAGSSPGSRWTGNRLEESPGPIEQDAG